MSIEEVIEHFCSIGSRVSAQRESSGNLESPTIPEGSHSSHGSRQDIQDQLINLKQFVTKCCFGLQIDPNQIIDDLLSVGDEQDIVNGIVTEIELKTCIEGWIKLGRPSVSGKVK